MRYSLLILLMASCLTGCSGMAFYETPPPQVEEFGTGNRPVKPDMFKVRSDDYPNYTVFENLKPPGLVLHSYMNPKIEFVSIEKSDTWKVTHKIGERYILQSKEFNERQCRYLVKTYGKYFLGAQINILGSCLRNYDFAVYVNAKGEINGGWEMLPSDRILGSNRYMYMTWPPEKNEGWPKGVVFVPNK